MDDCIMDALHRLDTMAQEVTDYEASFLASVMQHPGSLRPQDKAALARLCAQYLPDGDLRSAEILGQLTLWGLRQTPPPEAPHTPAEGPP